MKKVLALVLALALILGATAAMADPITLTYAEVNPADTIVGKIAADFKAKLEELSGGEILVDVQYSGVLGAEAKVLDGILMGGDTVDVARISAFALSSYGCSKATLLSLPYTFTGEEHFWKFAESDLAKEFLAEPQTMGLPLRGLAYGEEGFRHFFFKNEVTDIDSLKGMKVRVSEDPIMTGMVSALGANAAVVPFTELYSALQTGVVDAAEQPIANYKANAFPEVAPYLMLDGHTLGAVQLIITDNAWNKLTAEQQAWVEEAAAYASAENKAGVAAAEAAVTEELIAAGCTIIPVEDKSAWQAAVADVDAIKAAVAVHADLYQQIIDMQ
ncbi:MAG: TRAP transporter substrate-binding protein [Clostridia bacterium]|nr:TRAP transporter substrate-binding protein [Clostridia bacterium]